jgi:hypothetical protein
MGEPIVLEQAQTDLRALIARLEEELFEIRGETSRFDRVLRSQEEQLSKETKSVARLRGDLTDVRGEYEASREMSEVQDIIAGRLVAAQQELTEEMKRLQAQQVYSRPPEAPVGGIPVDSEYIIFIIDTSGSMQRFAWPLVQVKMKEVLDAYPSVKGLQIMNDEGVYMFSRYAGQWIPDTKARREAIMNRLRGWNAFSNSSPVEGIEAAIRTYWQQDRRISLYVFGDEFTGDSIDEVLETVDHLNRPDRSGERKVRIHAIGFPTIFAQARFGETTGVRFATLMRLLCERNGGAFVALNSLTP